MKYFFEKVLPDSGSSLALDLVKGDRVDCVFHFHPEYELTLIESGRGGHFIGEELSDYEPGELALIGPMTPHFYFNRANEINDNLLKVVKFGRDFADGSMFMLPELAPARQLLRDADNGIVFPPGVAEAAKQKMRELFTQDKLRRLFSLLELLNTLAQGDYRRLNAQVFVETMRDGRMNRVLKLVHQRLNQNLPLTLAEAAKVAAMTPESFSRYFKMSTRKAFVNYLIELRVSRAARLLRHSDLPVWEIAERCTFGNLSNFNRQFKRVNHLTPREFRNLF